MGAIINWNSCLPVESVSFSFTNLDLKNDYRFTDPNLRHW